MKTSRARARTLGQRRYRAALPVPARLAIRSIEAPRTPRSAISASAAVEDGLAQHLAAASHDAVSDHAGTIAR